ncbi:L-glutamine ABC transporter ATP-binding protein [Alkalispirillum mobile]|uniref:L-glutamine ABC transporter ATP-binding protein n=1 Tax=Alkalispirillum mobile TaxID=85925 RepID=A0A498BVD5_9GAMM|nr:amino acid ABC transporter ATP-binding protein [Alkalispirillum mobile]RLK46829.1 L-glutamine ABC transporter ATP-binding protein [Alkalispirillum mobile]
MSLIRCEKLCKAFGETRVLEDIDLVVDPGEVVVLVGPSGSGKSTLLRCLSVLERPTAGVLEVDGQRLGARGVRPRDLRRQTGMVFQQFNLFPHMSARDNVMLGPRKVRGLSGREARTIADRLLERVGLSDRADHYPAELSGGQQQRVAIARALAVNPKVMLFDEPTSALDPELRGEVLRVMQGLAEEGTTMIIVTHEMRFAEQAASRLLFMDEGRIVHDGAAQAMLAQPPSERFREFIGHVGH